MDMSNTSEQRAYDMGYEEGRLAGYAEGKTEGYRAGYGAGRIRGCSEQFNKDTDWLKENYRRYFALRRNIKEFFADFLQAVKSE